MVTYIHLVSGDGDVQLVTGVVGNRRRSRWVCDNKGGDSSPTEDDKGLHQGLPRIHPVEDDVVVCRYRSKKSRPWPSLGVSLSALEGNTHNVNQPKQQHP